mgnify:CR=1 FL=1
MRKQINFFVRKPYVLGNFSIENFYKTLKKNLDLDFDIKVVEMPFFSRGIISRLLNCCYCFFNQGDINHVIGDIHYVAIFLKRDKTILTILDCISLYEENKLKRLFYKYFWFVFPIKTTKHITFISEFSKFDTERLLKLKLPKSLVIGVTASEVFTYCKLPKNKTPNILQVGTNLNKNIKTLAFSLRDLNIELVIIGKLKISDKDLLIKNKINYTEIDKPLSIQEVYQYYQRADLITFLSTYEGFGLPILESNIVGRPVITSNIGCMPEVAGNAAILVNPYDNLKIKEAIVKALNDNDFVNSLIDNGFKNSHRFTPKKISSEYSKLYNRI